VPTANDHQGGGTTTTLRGIARAQQDKEKEKEQIREAEKKTITVNEKS